MSSSVALSGISITAPEDAIDPTPVSTRWYSGWLTLSQELSEYVRPSMNADQLQYMKLVEIPFPQPSLARVKSMSRY